MQIDLCNKLVDNDLTKEELLKRVEIRKTNVNDLNRICNTLEKSFNLRPNEALWQLENSNALLDECVKLVDKETDEIYGILIFCDYPIGLGSPIRIVENEINSSLEGYRQINGHSFIIDERLRNCGLDKKMLSFNSKFLLMNYDFIWIGVEKSLRSFSYWNRLGFTKIFEIPQAVFFMLPLSKKILNDYLLCSNV